MALSTHTALRNHHHHHASPQLFHHPEQQLCTHYTIGSLPHSPQPLLLLLSHFSRVRLCETPQTAAHQAPHPWDSPGKNTGVACHFPLQCMKVKSESEFTHCARLLATPWTAAHQAPPSMGFSRQEYWSGVPLPSPVKNLVTDRTRI